MGMDGVVDNQAPAAAPIFLVSHEEAANSYIFRYGRTYISGVSKNDDMLRAKPIIQLVAVSACLVLFFLIYAQIRSDNVLNSFRLDNNILNYVEISSSNILRSQNNESSTSQNDVIQAVKKKPGEYVHQIHPVPLNGTYCNFKYNLPYDLKFKKADVFTGPELKSKSKYRVIYNLIQAVPTKGIPRVTYATHVTAEFVNYLPELLRYWEGPISIAAFTPDLDVAFVLEQINQYCYCVPGMSRVSLHIVFPKTLMPSRKDIYFTRPDNCVVRDSTEYKSYRYFDETIIYPVNVLRNVARKAAPTKYSMVSDVQLMPSAGLAKKFVRMLNVTYGNNPKDKTVFVVPTFEVVETEDIPRNKSQLLQLLSEEKAVYFHQLLCEHCQKLPGFEYWNKTDPGNEVKPFVTIKREYPYHLWEPVYIGTDYEPYYNEGLSWEGLQDKMPRLLQMCLLDFDFTILDGAFLVHWPGINKQTINEDWRTPFIQSNMQLFEKLKGIMKKKYAPINEQCKIDAKVKLPGIE